MLLIDKAIARLRRTSRWRLGVVATSLVVGTAMVTTMSSAARPAASAAFDCTESPGLPDRLGTLRTAGMVRVPAGYVQLGSKEAQYRDELPTGEKIRVAAFWMDRTEVTNAQFAAFVQATGYVTEAEREGAAAVFVVPDRALARSDHNWWVWTRGANWRLPQGPASPERAHPNEPVVLVTYADALAYARWLGRDLPTEAEWEYAARGGGSAERIDREPRDPKGRLLANYWQGFFPYVNTTEDGFAAVAPVGCFPANGYGLSDMIGNVWELTRDRYEGPHQPHGNGDPNISVQAAHAAPRRGERMVIKGGSFLCAASYCIRYRVAARYPHESDMPTSHVGFRTVFRDSAMQSGMR
jgi:formylglycine-generating enzyme